YHLKCACCAYLYGRRRCSQPHCLLCPRQKVRRGCRCNACYLEMIILFAPSVPALNLRITFAMNPPFSRLVRHTLFLLAGLLCIIGPASLRAQRQRGEVHLEVRDPRGASVAARGELLSEGANFHRSFQIPSDGRLVLQDLPFGVYRLNLSAEGFAL